MPQATASPLLSGPRSKPPGRRVAVREVAHHGLDQRLQDAVVADLAEQAQRAAADVLVRVHQIVPQRVAHQNHLLAEVARLLVSLLDNLERGVRLHSTEQLGPPRLSHIHPAHHEEGSTM